MTEKETFFKIQSIIQKKNATLVAVSKTKTVAEIMQLYELGQRNFGENKVQELIQKHAELPKDINWHLIGHLQTNKVTQVLPLVSLIHSVDSIKLLNEIQKQALKINKQTKVLVQLLAGHEKTKYGLNFDNAEIFFNEYHHSRNKYSHVKIVGIMGMATHTTDSNIIAHEFKLLHEYFLQLKKSYFNHQNEFKECSMGMSSDYEIALNKGSTMVRIGSLLFGNRN